MPRIGFAALFALGVALAATEALAQATAVSVSGTSYTQNFDGIATGSNSSIATAAQGWSFWRSGTSSVQPNYTLSGSNTTAVTQNAGTVGTGVVTSTSGGGAYLWVSGTLATGTDKSIGFLTNGSYPGGTSAAPGQSLAILFGFTNTTGGTITNLDLAWNYERYRQGSRTQIWEFYTSTDGSTWSANTLGNSLQYTGTSNSVVYNPPESAAKAVTIPSLSISNGSSYYLRWSYMTTGSWSNGQGLGLDDFTMNFTTSGGGSPDLYWGGAAGWTATAPGAGGTGTWADGSGAWDASKKANFGGTAGTVTAAIVTASNGLAFTTTGYTLTGGTITLAGTSSGINAITTGTDGTVTTTINSVLAGSAGLTKQGGGTLALTGSNTYTGATTVAAGTLAIGSGSTTGSVAGDIVNDAAVTFNRSDALAYAGTISGTGTVTKQGAGNLVLGGTSTYTGATTVAAGRLSVNGALGSSPIAVLAAAELGGSGSVGGAVSVANGGTLAPGNSIASLATGTATFAAGATFGYEVDSTNPLSLGSAADLLVVSGDLNLDPGNGTILALTDLAGSPNAFVNNTTIFALINYSGTWNGGLFTYGGTPLADGGTFTVGSQQWLIDYNRTSEMGIDNFTGDYLPASSFVTITAVPEPSTYCMALAGLACGGYSMWRRRKKS